MRIFGYQGNKNSSTLPADRLQSVLDLLLEVNLAEPDYATTPRLIIEKVKSRLGYPFASIFILDENKDQARLCAFTGEIQNQLSQSSYYIEAGSKSMIGNCLRKKKPITEKKVTTFPDDPRALLISEYQASAALPLISNGNLLGVLEILAGSPTAFTPSEMEVLSLLAFQLASLYLNASRFASIKRKLDLYHSIQEMIKENSQDPSLDILSLYAIQFLHDFLPDARIAFLIPENKCSFKVLAYVNYEIDELKILDLEIATSAASLTAQEQKSLLLEDDQESRGLSPDSHSILTVPIQSASILSGILNIESPQIDAFTKDDQEIVSVLADNLALILGTMLNIEESRSALEKQKQLFEAAQKIHSSVNIETIMRTSAEVISSSLNLPKVTVLYNKAALPSEISTEEQQT